jgi:WhiB family transcriptional regulator, redox-sensing transcriptional regulator
MLAREWHDVFENGWESAAACRGEDLSLYFAPNYFEPYAVKRARESRAKAICRRCPVREVCRDYALEARVDHGVWGGLNESERRRILKARDREHEASEQAMVREAGVTAAAP